jgi:hypothetical protein
VRFERSKVMQMPDNGRVVLGCRAIACADAPSQCTQLIRCRFDRIDAGKRRNLRLTLLRQRHERADGARQR